MSKQRPPQGSGAATVTTLVHDEIGPLALARALADVASEAMMLIDQNGRVLHANPQALALFSTDASDLKGRDLRVLVPGVPGDLPRDDSPCHWRTRVLLPREGIVDLAVNLHALDPPRRSLLALLASRIDRHDQVTEHDVDVERWALAAQGSSDGFWHRPDVGVDAAWWSPRLYEMFGLSPSEIPPTFSALLSRLHPEDRESFLAERERCLLRGEAFDVEVRMRHASGEYRHFRVRARVTRMRDGRPLSLSGSLQDVTALRRTREALEANESRMRDFASAASDFFFEMDDRFNVTWLSENFTEVTGVDRHSILDRPVEKRRSPATSAAEWDAYLATLKRRTAFRDLIRTRKLPGGRSVFLSLSAFPLLDADGEFRGYRGSGTDVSARMEMELARHESERRFRDFAELAADYFWETDADLLFTFVSENCQVVNGLAPEHVLGKHLLEAFDDRYEDDDQRARYRADLDARRATTLELTRVRPDERVVRVSASARPIFDDDGRFTGFRGITRDITEAHELSARLAFQASHDALTGLVNRVEFERRLNRLLDSTRRDGSSHALCYLDLDQFKVVNDTCGHMAGDALLERLAETLTFRVRQRDTVARLGGDEFGILIEHCSVEQATRVASVLHQAISEFVFTWEDKQFQVGASVGLVPITPDLGNATDLLGAADSACYLAKEQGRNRIHVYARDDEAISRRRGEMNWVSHISGALSENRFRLRAQPVLPLSPRHAGAHHCELLVVMLDRDGNEIQPGAFLPAAERYNLANRIDRWVIQAALEWLSSDTDQRGRPALTGINLSAQSLGETDFLDFVRGECERRGVPLSRLCFEITETAAIANLDTARRLMDSLRSDGARFALDDFGKGLSSFGYLRSLPVDYIKIDAQFVRDMTTDPIDLAMVRSINEVARLMHKYTIAEGVESHEVLNLLREVGVNYAQGFAIGRPRFI